MGSAWAQALLGSSLLLQVLWTLLSFVSCSHGPPGWRFSSSEVVIPRKVQHRGSGTGRTGQLSYSMFFQGRRHIVHMKVKKNLLPRHFPVITDNDQGAMQEDYPYVPGDCYYLSYLEGVPGSMATLDTCSGGLRGMLQVDDLTYEIKPLETSSKFEHVVSLLLSEKNTVGAESCTIEGESGNQPLEEENLAESPRASPVYLWTVHKRQLKIHYTISNSLYLKKDNITYFIEIVVIINNIMDSIYGYINLNVFIRLLCIWNKMDHFSLNSKKSDVFTSYGNFKIGHVYNKIQHDTSLLLTGHRIGSRDYVSFPHSVCNSNWGVQYVHLSRYHLFWIASIAVHLIGHGLYMKHDEEYCRCFRRSKCVMAPGPGFRDMFSNCSYADYFHLVTRWDPCLRIPYVPYYNFPYKAARCGDKNVDPREECDCGSFKECSEDTCCLTNCMLALGSLCNAGDCCHNCRYLPPGSLCRDIRGICDLPEYCNGKNHLCPDDTYMQDGTPCSPLAVCVQGNCSDRNRQCQALFGHHVSDASPGCYEQLNIRGDRFGNCGHVRLVGSEKPLKCEDDDVLCGMLHCRGIKQIPGGGHHSTFRQIRIEEATEQLCFGYDFHIGLEKISMALVLNGAVCGPGKYCFGQNCTYFQDLGFTCNVSKCHYRGVCNNHKNCHCLRGWKPPFCAEKGAGGSIDSGPPPEKEGNFRASLRKSADMKLVTIFFRLILFLCSFIVGIFSQIKHTWKVRK